MMALLAMIFVASKGFAQYTPVDAKSKLEFTIKNLGFPVTGTFGGFEGKINFDTQNATANTFDVTINAATVNTDNGLRDEHLRGDNYFDVKNNPRIHLVSTKVEGGNGKYVFTGQLTIKGKVKQVSFPFTAAASGNEVAFKGTFKMNRRDFNLGGASTISDELEVTITAVAKKG